MDGGSDAGQATSEQHSSIADQDEFGINGVANEYGDDTFEEEQEASNSAVSYDVPQKPNKINVKTFSDFLDANKQEESVEAEELEKEEAYSEVQSEIEYDNDPPPKMKIMAFSGIFVEIVLF